MTYMIKVTTIEGNRLVFTEVESYEYEANGNMIVFYDPKRPGTKPKRFPTANVEIEELEDRT